MLDCENDRAVPSSRTTSVADSVVNFRSILRSIGHRNAVLQAFVLSSLDGGQTLIFVDVEPDPCAVSEVVPEPAAVRLNVIDAIRNCYHCACAISILEAGDAASHDDIKGTGDLLGDFNIGPSLQVVGLIDVVRIL